MPTNQLDPLTVAAELLANAPKPSDETPVATAPAPTQPEASQPSPVATEAQAASTAATADQPRDKFGHAFRPGFHRTNADGTPYISARGLYMPRGGKRPRAATAAPAETAPVMPDASGAWSAADKATAAAQPEPEPGQTAAQPAPAQQTGPDTSEAAAEVFCRGLYAVLGFALECPEDVTPGKAEHDNMQRATAAYIRAKGWTATAGWGVLLMFAAYLLRLITRPGPSAKVKAWLADWKVRRAKPVTPTTPATPADKPATTAATYPQTFGSFRESPAA